MRKWANKTVNSGVVALKIDASPLAMRVSPYTISVNGMTLFSSPMTRNAIQIVGEVDMRRPLR